RTRLWSSSSRASIKVRSCCTRPRPRVFISIDAHRCELPEGPKLEPARRTHASFSGSASVRDLLCDCAAKGGVASRGLGVALPVDGRALPVDGGIDANVGVVGLVGGVEGFERVVARSPEFPIHYCVGCSYAVNGCVRLSLEIGWAALSEKLLSIV